MIRAILATRTAAAAIAPMTDAIADPTAIIGAMIPISAIAPSPPRTHLKCFVIKSKTPPNFSKISGLAKNLNAAFPTIPKPIAATASSNLSNIPLTGEIIP